MDSGGRAPHSARVTMDTALQLPGCGVNGGSGTKYLQSIILMFGLNLSQVNFVI